MVRPVAIDQKAFFVIGKLYVSRYSSTLSAHFIAERTQSRPCTSLLVAPRPSPGSGRNASKRQFVYQRRGCVHVLILQAELFNKENPGWKPAFSPSSVSKESLSPGYSRNLSNISGVSDNEGERRSSTDPSDSESDVDPLEALGMQLAFQ